MKALTTIRESSRTRGLSRAGLTAFALLLSAGAWVSSRAGAQSPDLPATSADRSAAENAQRMAAKFSAQFSDKNTDKQPQKAVAPGGLKPAPAPVFDAAFDPALAAGSPAVLGTAETTGEVLPMLVGHSMFINMGAPSSSAGAGGPSAGGSSVGGRSPLRLRRIYVSDPTVLDSYTASPRQIVITAKAPGASSLVLWDEAGRSQVFLAVVSLDVASLQEALKRAFPLENIQATAEQDKISLSGKVGSQVSIDAALKLAGIYSKNVVDAMLLAPAHARQVQLKVRIVEVDRSRLDEFGLNFFGGPKNPSGVTTGQFPVGTSVTGSTGTPGELTVSDPLNLFLFNSALSVGVTIKDLESKQVLQILAEPTITTMSGEKASFLSGGEFPFPIIEGGAGALASVTIQFRPYGVKLEFTPLVNADGTIYLKVAPEVSALDYTNAVTISGYTIPALSTRRAETQVELRSGQSFAISGLLDHRVTDVLSRVPVAGSLPVIGQLFRSKNLSHSVVELFVIVTPTVIDPLTDTTPVSDPPFVLPFLDEPAFDKSLPVKKLPASGLKGVPIPGAQVPGPPVPVSPVPSSAVPDSAVPSSAVPSSAPPGAAASSH